MGKIDSRFQALLRGSEFIGFDDEPVAKGRGGGSRFGYPIGARHEFLSAELIQNTPELLDAAHDSDLVIHLVTSHHGRGRCWPIVVDDPEPVEVEWTIDGVGISASTALPTGAVGVATAERFWRLNKRYGPHGLAWLETILRLADHRRSEMEVLS